MNRVDFGKFKLLLCHHARASTGPSTRTGGRQPRHGAFVNKVSFEFRKCGEYSKHEPVRRCRGIDIAGQYLEPNAPFLQIAHQANDMRKRTADTIELPYNEGVTVPSDVERFCQTGALSRATRAHVAIDPLAPSSLQFVALKIELLFAGLYAHVAN